MLDAQSFSRPVVSAVVSVPPSSEEEERPMSVTPPRATHFSLGPSPVVVQPRAVVSLGTPLTSAPTVRRSERIRHAREV